jgi:hypothetical protein
MLCSISGGLKDDLQTKKHFIELVVAKLPIGFTEVGPGMHVVGHELDPISMDVVVHPEGDRAKVIVRHLARIVVARPSPKLASAPRQADRNLLRAAAEKAAEKERIS